VKKTLSKKTISKQPPEEYGGLFGGIAELLEAARHTAARTVNAVMTATYWEIGRRIVEFEQQGQERAGYGEQILAKLSQDLTKRFGRGFGVDNLQRFRSFFLSYPTESIYATLSRKLPEVLLVRSQTPPRKSPSGKSGSPIRKLGIEKYATASRNSTRSERPWTGPQPKGAALTISNLASAFPLPWSHYVRLLSVKSVLARDFYHTEALRGGWSVRQLDRQIASQFYERTAASRNKNAMLRKGAVASAEDSVSADEEVRDPLVLEFLGLKDEYSETDLEEALLRHLENFLLELGGDFAFIGRQRRLRIGGEWYRVDLLFFQRKLRCLVVIDLKVGKFTHADAGQMHLYLNYAREHWTQSGENPPVGLILCAEKDDAIAKYALEGLPNKVLAREYKLALPDEKRLVAEIEKTRELLERKIRE
jgi:predicted nuclease of restriction endonuclease-like (RecB) superfamily